MTKQILLERLEDLRAAAEQLPDDSIVRMASIDESYGIHEPRLYMRLESGVRELAATCGASVNATPLGKVLVSATVDGVEFSQLEPAR